MKHVDALSRNPVGTAKEVEPVLSDMMVIDISNSDFLMALQRQDPRLCAIIDVLNRSPETDEERQMKQKVIGELCFVVPNRVRWRMVHTYHDEMGHFSVDKVLERLKRKFWFPKMRKYVRSYIQACPQCALYKSKGGRPEGFLHPLPKEPVPFGTVHIDHMGPFIRSARGNSYVLLLTCGFSKFVVVRAVRSTKSGPVITFMEEVTAIFGAPGRIITDRGTAFTAKKFEDYCRENNISHTKTSVGSPRANGQVERSNRTVLNIQWSVNNMPNATTSFTPSSLVLSYLPRDINQNVVILALQQEEDNVVEDAAELREQAIRAIEKGQRTQKRYFDEHRTPGDMVLVERDLTAMGHSRKLESRFKGPYEVKKVLGNERYELEEIHERQGRGRVRTTVYAADRIKRWCQLEDLEGCDEAIGNEDSEMSAKLQTIEMPSEIHR
uniref:RNA-directed DNA polymerase n=1 Tax=Anopheles atroparvus TaxID=41427 RepID=A0AAG5DQZ0_ANOAO